MKNLRKIAALLVFVGLTLSANAQLWNRIAVPTTQKLNTVDFPSNTIGYIGGDSLTLLKTTDAGRTWNHIAFTGITTWPGGEHFLALEFVSETIGFAVVGPYGNVYKTVDGGLSWVQVQGGSSLCYYNAAFFFDENNGFVGGAGCFYGEAVTKLDNGVWGNPVDVGTPQPTSGVMAIDFYRANYGLAATYAGFIMKTIDGGLTWDTINVPVNLNTLTDVLIIDDTLAYATYEVGGGGFGILKSTDAGDTWADDWDLATFFYPDMYAVHQSNSGKMFFGGQTGWDSIGVVFSSSGQGWYDMYTVDQPVYDIDSHTDSVAFVVGDSGFVATNVDPLTLSIMAPVQQIQFEAYPNPFQNEIVVELPDFMHSVQLQLVDVSGKKVFEAVLNAPYNAIQIPELSKGTYIMMLQEGEKKSHRVFIKN